MAQNHAWRTRPFWLASSTLTGIMLTAFGLSACQSRNTGKVETINFGAVPGSAPLAYIAQEQHFFDANGLSVNVKDNYTSGVATTDALLKGDVDIVWAAEFAMVRRAFEKRPISNITIFGRFTTQFLFARKDRGVATISDLKGRKIGVLRNTIAEFYLVRFLALNGVNPQDVSLVDLPAAQSLEQITSGRIDCVVTWEPYASPIRRQLGDRVGVWSIQSSQPGYGVIVARNDWLSASPEITNRFLRSLAQAEDYIVRNPEAAKTIVQKHMGLDDAPMQVFWSEIQSFLSLDQSLVSAMEDEARWMIKNNLTPEKQVPDFLNYIYLDGLKKIKPEAVNIIR
jgi:NitT/TauT family transport system substrate-binding protein